MRVEGGANVIRALRRIGSEAERDAIATTMKYTTNIENDAKGSSPVDTGNLKRNITQQIDRRNIEGTVTSGADYGIFVELGTRHMSAQPFMRPAFKKNSGPYRSELNALIARGRRGFF